MIHPEEVPTLYPTEEEFENPIEYFSSPKVKSLGVKYGMIKVVPPLTFNPPLSVNTNKFKFTPRIQKLNELNLINRCRLFFMKQLKNFNQMKKLWIPKNEYEVINLKKIYFYDLFIEIVKFMKKVQNHQDATILPNIFSVIILSNNELWKSLSEHFEIDDSFLKELYSSKLLDYFNFLSSKPDFTSTLIEEKYPSSLLYDDSKSDTGSDISSDEDDEEYCLVCHKNSDPSSTLLCDSCDKAYHMYCLSPPLTKIPKESWYCDNCIIGNGYYGFKDSSYQYNLEDFKNLCKDFDTNFFGDEEKPDIYTLEETFWELVNDDTGTSDVKVNYGADIRNNRDGEISGFPTSGYIPRDVIKADYKDYLDHPMNLNNLPYDKNSLLNYLNVDISGMTIPWIYVGSTFSTFCWHVEDQYTLSANYQHFGSIKRWYSIPESFSEVFEAYMQNLAPDLFAKQPDILHQLITLVSPDNLIRNGISCFAANQNPGEYIITYPRVYHAGFNSGFNFNEAVNFTMDNWLEFGVKSTINYRKNNSKKDSVFDVYQMMINILKEYTTENPESNIKDDLAQKCITFLKEKLIDESVLKSTILDKLQTKPQIYTKLSRKDFNYKENLEAFDDDGISCSKCKGFCSFNYIKHYDIGLRLDATYLPTPNSSPSESRRQSKRLKIMTDIENYKIEILCLDDYIKLNDSRIDYRKDELFVVKELDEIKELIVKGINRIPTHIE
ncbi:hypothetical protein WICMUC_005783 [Wickerhamomyces mucosus]|uniref:Histone demethylase JHD2 n=1 Tax=Wickerhamomyces mucosus TaxID=1378264 RepID=A0A9P8T310_9ASCO|nr:hypothetical protein WICMUC_005783 [Wickerhamomyces mucosus]